MRFPKSILVALIIANTAFAQYSNSWINFGQTYYKIKIGKEGIYQLTYDDLNAAGFPVNSVDPRLIQVFHRGTEQAIFFKHNQVPADSKFDATEYLEFFGQKNDGTLDAKLYQPNSAQPHPYYNLHSDTTAYFLTWNILPVQGKRMDPVDLTNSTNIPKETFHLPENLTLYTSQYSGGNMVSDYIRQSSFEQGEGWTGSIICTLNSGCTGQQDFSFDLKSNIVTSGDVPRLEVLVAGRDNLSHRVEIYAGPNTGALRLITTQDFINFETPVIASDLNWSDVAADGKVTVRVKGIGVGGVRERVSVSYIKIRYSENFNFSGINEKMTFLKANPSGKSYIELENAASGIRIWDVTDPDNLRTIGTRTSGTSLTAVIDNATTSRKLLSSNQVNTVSINQIEEVSFSAIEPTAHDFIIITHPNLMKPGLSYANPVSAYAEYRASAEGGGYNPLMVTVNQLYDQFNYGEISALAIYEFMRYLVALGNPKYLFLIGKGREIYAGMYRKTTFAAGEFMDLVPTAGTPGSDMTFTAGLSGEAYVPAVATGRLTASTPAQVAAYLNKVKEAEAVPFQELWRKKILHLSGGIEPGELTTFRQYMDGFADIAEGLYLGGQVETVGKHDPEPTELINISDEINKGVNLVTFFGHSSSTDTDIDIGFVSEPIFGYNNVGKYPAFLVNGCNAGEFFNNGTNFGEDWMLASGKGARNFIANSSFGFDGVLRLYTEIFYRVGFADSAFIKRGIGEVQAEVARRYLDLFSTPSPIYTAQVQQMILLGDPALRLFGADKPDFDISDESITVATFDNKPIHALVDSFRVEIRTKNMGVSTSDSLLVRVKHTFNDNTFEEYDSLFKSVLAEDTLKIVVKRDKKSFFGNNKLDVTLDPLDSIVELNESNNGGEWSQFIPFNGTKNLQPPNYGIASSTEVDLVFQNTDLLAEATDYVVELDTTSAFDSDFLQSQTVTGGVLNKVRFTVLPDDSTVYYWRTRLAQQTVDQWETTSFAYIDSSPEGWAQMHFDQITDNALSGLVPDAAPQRLEFESTSVSVFVKTFGSANPTSNLNGSFQIDNAEYYFSTQGFNCRDNTINLVAFDKNTVVPYLGIPFTFQNSFGRSCGREPMLINSFMSNEVETGNNDDLIQYIDNIKLSDSVIIFSMGDAGFASWSAALKAKMGELGVSVSDIDSFLPGEPVVILGRKGVTPGTARIIKSDQPSPETQELQLIEDLTGIQSSGSMKSVIIGPALSWKNLYVKVSEKESSDTVNFDIYGVMLSGQEVLLSENITLPTDLTSVDAGVYPYLKLVYTTQDEINLSPAQLKNWIVTYDPAPDGIVMFGGQPDGEEVQEGAAWSTDFGFVNISSASFADSLKVELGIFNTSKSKLEKQDFKIKGPLAGDTTFFSVNTSTIGKIGANDISIAVNRNILPEQYYSNNSIELPDYLNVWKDNLNPILDVTFDGRYLANGDYVSANPLILIRVMDENPFLLQTDTTGVSIFLTYPCDEDECSPAPVHFSSEEIKWTALSSANELQVEFRPVDLADGDYTLIVQAKDVSGNPGGAEPYQVNFKVRNEPTLRFFEPYPNPSASGFFFEFQISGDVPPTGLDLQIFNRQGQRITEFTEEDFSAFHIGTNQMKWEANDEQGNQLADGLYFYRMIVRTNDQEYRTQGSLLIIR